MTLDTCRETVEGPDGTFRVELHQGDDQWLVHQILVDDRPNGPIGTNFACSHPTAKRALDCARARAGLPTRPLPDRRGLVAHSRKL